MLSTTTLRGFTRNIAVCCLFSVLALITLSACGRDDEIAARVMSVLETRGDSVTLQPGATRTSTQARDGMRLHEGYTISTGADSFCYIQLDRDSVIRVDEHSRITVERLSAELLTIEIERGQVMIDVQNQDPGHALETRIGNTVIGVRGTLFVAGHSDLGSAVVAMLEGTADVDGRTLAAGYVMHIYDERAFAELDAAYAVRPLVLGEMDAFALQAVLDYQDRIIGASSLAPHDLQAVPQILTELQAAAQAAPAMISISEFEQRVFELTNIERANHGLQPLTWCDALAAASRAHSEDLAQNNMSSHTGSDGSTPAQRAERFNAPVAFWAENVFTGQRTPEATVAGWMNSTGHRANILRATATHLGVGVAVHADGWRFTSVQKFGRDDIPQTQAPAGVGGLTEQLIQAVIDVFVAAGHPAPANSALLNATALFEVENTNDQEAAIYAQQWRTREGYMGSSHSFGGRAIPFGADSSLVGINVEAISHAINHGHEHSLTQEHSPSPFEYTHFGAAVAPVWDDNDGGYAYRYYIYLISR